MITPVAPLCNGDSLITLNCIRGEASGKNNLRRSEPATQPPRRQARWLPPHGRGNLVPGSDVRTVDSGCCGMAGLFGYEEGHYEVSMKMGERRLFPAVRGAEGRVVVAPGTSCREQILGGTGRRALHPAEYLAQLLEE